MIRRAALLSLALAGLAAAARAHDFWIEPSGFHPALGTELIKAVHMQAAPAGVDADRESVWTSMTFEVR